MHTPARSLLLGSLLLITACGTDPLGYHSLAHAKREHPTLWTVEPNEGSRFGEVARAGPLTWLYAEIVLDLPPGRYLLDFSVSVPPERAGELRLEAEPGCGELTNTSWTVVGGQTEDGMELWQESPPLEFVNPQTCPVKLSILGENGDKQGWGLDWARVRRCGEGQELACPSGETE